MSDGSPEVGYLAQSGPWLPELDLPRYPRLVEGLRVMRGESVTFVIGGAEPLSLTGSAARWVTAELFPLLDGTRSVVELKSQIGDVSHDQLLSVLRQLYFNALLEAGEDDEGACQLSDRLNRQARFLSHHLRITGRHRSGRSAQRALLQASAVVAGRGMVAQKLVGQLTSDGVGRVLWCRTSDELRGLDRSTWPIAAAAPLVLCVEENPSSLNEACEAQGLAYLPIDLSRLVLGPITLPRLSACPNCVAAQYIPPVPLRPSPGGVPGLVIDLLRAAFLARAEQLAIGWLSWVFPNTAAERIEVWRVDPTGLQPESHPVVRLPRCHRCGDPSVRPTTTLASGHADSAALLYHRSTSIQPWHVQQPAIQQVHVRRDVVELTFAAHQDDRTEVCERLCDRPTPNGPASATGNLSARCLMELLRLCWGTCPAANAELAMRRRYVASGGNLASPIAYVLIRAVDGFPPGLYRYMSAAGDLISLGRHSPADHLGNAGDPAVLILASRLTALCEKYGDRGYLYAMLDAGLVLHRLKLLSDHSGLRSTLATDFDDEKVSTLLSIDGLTTVPLAVVGLAPLGESD